MLIDKCSKFKKKNYWLTEILSYLFQLFLFNCLFTCFSHNQKQSDWSCRQCMQHPQTHIMEPEFKLEWGESHELVTSMFLLVCLLLQFWKIHWKAWCKYMQAKIAPASQVFLRTLTHWVLQKQWLNYNKLKCCQQNALPTCPKCTVIGRLCSQVCTSFLCVDAEWVEVESSLLLDWLFSVISCKWSYQAEVFMARVCVKSKHVGVPFA